MTVRITEAEFARDVHAILDRIVPGDNVTIERDGSTVFTLSRSTAPAARPIDECIALARKHYQSTGRAPVPDSQFADDVKEFVDANRDPSRNVWDE